MQIQWIIILHQLYAFCVRGSLNQMFKMYFSKKTQYVSYGIAEINCLTHGFPQRSEWNSLLSLIYRNFKPLVSILFADDTRILKWTQYNAINGA